MDERVRVQVIASDPVVRAGIDATVRGCAELTVVADRPDVVVVVVDEVTAPILFLLRSLTRGRRRVLLVAGSLEQAEALSAIEAGACGLLRRREAGTDRLRLAVRATVDGEFTVPPDLLGGLLARAAGRSVDRAPSWGLTEREKAVLLMLADGHETEEIARSMAYSVRTVTGIVHNITHRLQLRNRAHAVAYALREGLI